MSEGKSDTKGYHIHIPSLFIIVAVSHSAGQSGI